MGRPKRKATGVTVKKPDIVNKNVNESCRVCMNKNIVFIDIFSSKSRNIAEEINYCTGLVISQTDTLTTKICCMCLNNLTTARNFKQQCLNSDMELRQIQNKIKEEIKEEIIEILDDDDDDCNDKDDVDFNDKDDVDWNDKDDDDGNDKDDDDRNDKDDDDWKPPSECELKNKDSETKIEIEIDTKTKINKKTREVYVKSTKEPRGKMKKEPKGKLKKEQIGKMKKEPKRKRIRGLNMKLQECTRCNIAFTKRQALADHNTNVHNEQETYICDVCAKIYHNYSKFVAHLRLHNPPKHFCDKCDYKTYSIGALSLHKSTHSGIKHIQCDKCEKAFYSKNAWRSHYIRLHDTDRIQRVFACPRCSRQFGSTSKLKRHIDTHDNIKRYHCKMCSNKFSRREFWKTHMHKVHNITIPPKRPGTRLPILPNEEQLLTLH